MRQKTGEERMNGCFTNDLRMVYPWTCVCLPQHQRLLTSENTMSGDRLEPWLICHYLKVDPEDGGKKSIPSLAKPSCPLACRHSSIERLVSKVLPLVFYFLIKMIKPLQHRALINCNLVHLYHCITEPEELYLTLKSTGAHSDSQV